ncbi:MAG: pyrroline-5-carboxylate reductase [Rhodospirillaceae bacterium]|nr:pyrroline-5-carboxylate reductase [Rhodospirillales bacterium]
MDPRFRGDDEREVYIQGDDTVTRVLLVGCGKMGSAMLNGWLDRGMDPAGLVVVEPGQTARDAFAPKGVTVVETADAIASAYSPDVVVLAVKPQVMEAVAPAYAKYKDSVFLSIAAGKPIAFFARLLGDSAIVRAMPNTPAAVRSGITVCVPNAKVDAPRRAACQALLEAVGEVAWTDDESLMDAVTAVSGSGPAYVFLLAEVMAKAGVAAGLPADLATRLARATVSGSGDLLRASADSAEQLRINVTSPGGTTAAALNVLMAEGRGFDELMTQAVAAAVTRGKELA